VRHPDVLPGHPEEQKTSFHLKDDAGCVRLSPHGSCAKDLIYNEGGQTQAIGMVEAMFRVSQRIIEDARKIHAGRRIDEV